MEKLHIFILSVFLCPAALAFADTAKEYDPLADIVFNRAQVQYSLMLDSLPDLESSPQSVFPDGRLKCTMLDGWTDGFFPGCLWLLYEYTGNPSWLEAAEARTWAMEMMKNVTSHHDTGFLIGSSFGNADRVMPSDRYKDVIVDAANSLSGRFSPAVGCIRSWNSRKSWDGNTWDFPVIIDNMMNLELLYKASRITGDSKYAEIADSHAEKTAKEHFRQDYGTWHVVDYDPVTGTARHKQTSQGYKDSSVWSRGQAWAIYGFTMAYRETGKPLFLETAMAAADFWTGHPDLPEDLVPYWDFDAASGPRDASAAAITASALLELSNYADTRQKRELYHDFAVRTLKSLASEEYLAAPGENHGFLLKHCTGSVPHDGEVDAPLIYADYYFLEALMRYRDSQFAGKPGSVKVLQLNILQEGTVVDGGFDAIADEIVRSGADMVFLEEIRNYGGKMFIPRLLSSLEARGAVYYWEDAGSDTAFLSVAPVRKINYGGPVRFLTEIGGRKIAAYALHLDYRNYACHQPRGYDGRTWEKMTAPVTDADSVLSVNRLSGRPGSIKAVIEASRSDVAAGYAVVVAGDFNEPSHLDWQENTSRMFDHNGAVIPWDCSMLLAEAGFKDVYREVWPDPLANPGFTYPSGNSSIRPERLTWAPDADERDRIDFIYVLGESLIPSSAEIYGPSSSIVRGMPEEEKTSDVFITPAGIWPSDHKGVYANLLVNDRFPDSANNCCILTPAPSGSPEINGPEIFGARPGSDFLYRIPATGIRPMKFHAEGLPKGLRLDEDTGIITGKVRRAGCHDVLLKAVNAEGSCEKPFRIEIGEKIALTPPMGWNSWNCWGSMVSAERIMETARAFVGKGLVDYGWSYVNIDDGWQGLRGGKYNAIQPNSKFPDMKALADSLHGMGLKIGLYSSPWVASYTGHIGSRCDNEEGTYGWIGKGLHDEHYELLDTSGRVTRESLLYVGRYSFVPEDVRQWDEWGIDYLKYDSFPNDYYSLKEMHDELRSADRDIVLSMSNNALFSLAIYMEEFANCWRTTGDIRDTWRSMSGIGFNGMEKWAQYAGPGHWPDADMLVVGNVGWNENPRPDIHEIRPTRLTPNEQYTHISLWALLSSPLLIGCDMAEIDDFTLNLLCNSEVIGINQDSAGYQAVPVLKDNTKAVYMKTLGDGSVAVGLFNRSEMPLKMGFKCRDFGIRVGEQTIRDVWRRSDLAKVSDNEVWETTVAPHGVVLLRISPGNSKERPYGYYRK